MEGVTNNEPVLSEEQLEDIAGGGPPIASAADNAIAKTPVAVASAAKFYIAAGETKAALGNYTLSARYLGKAREIMKQNKKADDYLIV